MSTNETYEGWTGVKHCSGCSRDLPLESFTRLKRRSGNEYASRCRECDRARCLSDRAALRAELLDRYSHTSPPSCEVCGESRQMVLEIDHRYGGGRNHRSQYSDIYSYYRDIKRRDFTDVLRVLCRNCNWIEYRTEKSNV